MKRLIITTILALFLAPGLQMASGAVKKPLDEAGITLNGYCKAIATAPDGSAYVLMKDCRLVHIDVDGEITEIKMPLNKEIKTMDDYFCDMAVDTKAVYFCGYNYSSIVALDLNYPKELKSMAIKFNEKDISPLSISKHKDVWTLKGESTAYKVSNTLVEALPENSQVVLDKNSKAVISVMPYEENGKTIWPGKILNADNSIKWIAPAPQAPSNVMGIEYLGFDQDRSREVYLVYTASGDCDGVNILYATDENGTVVSKKIIPLCNIDTLMRFCKLNSDGSVLAVYADPNEPDNKVILKKYELNNISKEELEKETSEKG